MKIILEPRVTVVGKPTFIPHPEYLIPDDGTDSEKLGAFAAKGCYDSYSPTGRANIANQIAVLESMHGSVLEHSHVSVFIEGITRGSSLELNRHRPFNISQRSTRYTKEEESAMVLEPYFAKLFRKYQPVKNETTGGLWFLPSREYNDEVAVLLNHINSCLISITNYAGQVEGLVKLNPNNLEGFELRKWARGKARNVLPHALETRGVWTNNFRGFRWFIELRSERHAEPEIRMLAHKIMEAVIPIAPTYFADFSMEMIDGIPEWKPKYSKV